MREGETFGAHPDHFFSSTTIIIVEVVVLSSFQNLFSLIDKMHHLKKHNKILLVWYHAFYISKIFSSEFQSLSIHFINLFLDLINLILKLSKILLAWCHGLHISKIKNNWCLNFLQHTSFTTDTLECRIKTILGFCYHKTLPTLPISFPLWDIYRCCSNVLFASWGRSSRLSSEDTSSLWKRDGSDSRRRYLLPCGNTTEMG